jgi:hypothetical protein
MNPEPQPAAEGSISALMTQLSSQTSRLEPGAMRLAHKDFVESASHAGIGAGLFSSSAGWAVWSPPRSRWRYRFGRPP